MRFFLSNGLYGQRKPRYFSIRHLDDGHMFICFEAWTLEVSYDHKTWTGRLLALLDPENRKKGTSQ